MTMTLYAKYPRLAVFRSDQSYAGVIIAQPEPGVGVIIAIPSAGGDATEKSNLELFDRVTVTNAQLTVFTGSVTLNSSKDPVVGP